MGPESMVWAENGSKSMPGPLRSVWDGSSPLQGAVLGQKSQKVCPKNARVWIPNRGYTRVFGSPTGAIYKCLSMPKCLDPQLGLHRGVWIPNRGYTQEFGFPTGATAGYLDPEAARGWLEFQTGDPASCKSRTYAVPARKKKTKKSNLKLG